MPATPPAFLLLDPDLDGLEPGDAVDLVGDEGRHAAKVARIGVGEQILLTDRTGAQALAEVRAAAKESLACALVGAVVPAPARSPRLALVQALATGGRDEQAVESATELGVDRITPWTAKRSVSVWKGPKLDKGRAKWEQTVRTAVKQCRRRGIPTVDAPETTAELVADVRERVAAGGAVLVLHEQESAPLLGLVDALREEEPQEVTMIVGPEGGIDDAELARLREAGARSVLLGPEVLRSSTAGPAAIAVLSALLGRWG